MDTKKQKSHAIYETWAPIIESKYGLMDSKKMETLCNYAHHHSLNESFLYSSAPYSVPNNGIFPAFEPKTSDADKTISLLPLALNILTGLNNLNEVHLTSGAEGILSERHQVSFNLSNEMIMDLKNSTLDSIDLVEKILTEKAIEYIDECILRERTIAGKNSITIMNTSQIIESIMVISEATLTPKMALKISFGLKSYK